MIYFSRRFINNIPKKVPIKSKLANNGFLFLFKDAHLDLNAVEIDRCKKIGVSSLIKNYISLSPNKIKITDNAG